MYNLYIPKYQKDPTSARLLPEELGRFMRVTNYAYDLLISPGYLSKTDKTIDLFLTETEKTFTASGRGCMGRDRVGLGLFHGMNGHNPIAKGSTSTILGAHNAELTKRSWLEVIDVHPSMKEDHRKMIFFFERRGWTITNTLCKGTIEDFLEKIAVKAILIGSSNFCWNTYYNRGYATAGKGEADLLMFIDEGYKEMLKEAIGDTNSPENPMALFGMIACSKTPEKFFEDILRDFLTHSLA